MIDIRKCRFNSEQKKDIRRGIPIELEHTKSLIKARTIAAQHVCEAKAVGKLYYKDILIPAEKKAGL